MRLCIFTFTIISSLPSLHSFWHAILLHFQCFLSLVFIMFSLHYSYFPWQYVNVYAMVIWECTETQLSVPGIAGMLKHQWKLGYLRFLTWWRSEKHHVEILIGTTYSHGHIFYYHAHFSSERVKLSLSDIEMPMNPVTGEVITKHGHLCLCSSLQDRSAFWRYM